MANLSEAQIQALIARVQSGESDAFGQIFDIFADRIFKFLHFRLGGDRETAQDLTSETFLQAFRSIGRYQTSSKAKFSTWLFSIAHHILLDHFRKSQKTKGQVDIEAISETLSDTSVSELTKADQQMRFRAVTRYLKKLPPDIAEVLTLKFIEEMEYAEIAQITGKNANHIRVLIHRGLKALRENIDD